MIHDFAYGDIGFEGYQPPSFLSVKGAKEVGCEFTTMSKGYNMAGWRVGFAAGNRDMLAALKAIKGYYDYGIFQAVQVAAIVALRHGEEGRLAQVAEYQGRRDALVRGLRRIGWDVETPRAGMFVWAAMPEPWRSQMGSIDFAMKLLEDANVAVSPGRGFGETGEGYLRLALVENAQRLQQAVRQIGRCLKTGQSRTSRLLTPGDRPSPSTRAREAIHGRLCLLREAADLRRVPGGLPPADRGSLPGPLAAR